MPREKRSHIIRYLGTTINYLLRDEFTTNRAGGALNGTAPEPGPGGNRAVTDVENIITISSAALQFANPATPAHGDESLTYTAISRVAGRVIVARANIATLVGNEYPLLLSNNAVVNMAGPGTVGHGFYMGGDVIYCTSGGDANHNGGNFADSIYYYLAIVLKATGGYFFIKGGAFADWTLLYENSTDVEATLYPAIAQYNGAFSIDFIRIPDVLWTPSGTNYAMLDKFIA